ncbi:hypothetical protein Tco_0146113 [Tanacetum coccineum]
MRLVQNMVELFRLYIVVSSVWSLLHDILRYVSGFGEVYLLLIAFQLQVVDPLHGYIIIPVFVTLDEMVLPDHQPLDHAPLLEQTFLMILFVVEGWMIGMGGLRDDSWPGEGLMNLATKSDEAEELCSCTTGGSIVDIQVSVQFPIIFIALFLLP